MAGESLMPAGTLAGAEPVLVEHEQLSARIGLDIGGTKTAGGLVLFPGGHVESRRVIATRPRRDGYDVLQDTLNLAADLIRDAGSRGYAVDGIGAGVAELVDADGEITSAACIPWRGIPLRQRLAHLAPAVVDADVRVAALGEALYGAGRQYDCFVFLTVGTGISHTLVQGRRPYAGAHGNALVLASGATSHTCPHCGQRTAMVLEEYASGPAIARRYAEKTGRDGVAGEDVTRGASSGDSDAIEIVSSAGTALGAAVGFLVNVLDPGAIVVGGGLGLSGGRYWQALVESTRAHIWADGSRDVPIVTAALGADAGVIGAAAACTLDRPGTARAAEETG
jgi:glucokinase